MATSYYSPVVFKEGTDAPSASAPLKFILTDNLSDSDTFPYQASSSFLLAVPATRNPTPNVKRITNGRIARATPVGEMRT